VIYVEIEGVKSDGRGAAGGSLHIDTDDVLQAIGEAFASHQRMWDALGHGAAVTYTITVATEASPRRTIDSTNRPLPVRR
jgi:hypothetical protein